MLDELRKRGIEYLLSQRKEDIQVNEFTASELSEVLRIEKSSVYEHMETLVKQGLWGTRLAFHPGYHKVIKVWWLISE